LLAALAALAGSAGGSDSDSEEEEEEEGEEENNAFDDWGAGDNQTWANKGQSSSGWGNSTPKRRKGKKNSVSTWEEDMKRNKDGWEAR
jgi:hypothetical protein